MCERSRRPLIVQSDLSLLLEVGVEGWEACRDAIAPFCDLVKSPDLLHTYRITPLSVWNAAASGVTLDRMLEALRTHSRFDLPAHVEGELTSLYERYGRLRLERGENGDHRLTSDTPGLLQEVQDSVLTRDLLGGEDPAGGLKVPMASRGLLKRALLRLGWPVEDLAGYVEGGPLAVVLRDELRGGGSFRLRPYQEEAVRAFDRGGSLEGGSGVVVLPCGAGKTIVGLAIMARLGRKTLILAPGHTAVRQWRREILEKTTLKAEEVGEYTGEHRQVRPVTIATYQMLTWRRTKTDRFAHLDLFGREAWGLIIYDEVHLLPAPVFRATAEIQATRRLGLTATLVREDGLEEEVFTLVGPRRYDVPWRVLERQGFIATARCMEVRLPMARARRRRAALGDRRARFRLAAENPHKQGILDLLLRHHAGDRVLVIGHYLDQLHSVSRRLNAPLLTGRTLREERLRLYEDFQSGRAPVLVVSKVGNFAVDLPEARVIVQVSGTFGSRQEEAQRLGRILRPKADGAEARFYTLVSEETPEEDYAHHRQQFLTEQGYTYQILSEAVLRRNLGESGAALRNGVAASVEPGGPERPGA